MTYNAEATDVPKHSSENTRPHWCVCVCVWLVWGACVAGPPRGGPVGSGPPEEGERSCSFDDICTQLDADDEPRGGEEGGPAWARLGVRPRAAPEHARRARQGDHWDFVLWRLPCRHPF